MSRRARGFERRPAWYGETDSTLGAVWVALSDRGLARAEFATNELAFCHGLHAAGFEPVYDPAVMAGALQQFHDVLAGGRRWIDLPLDLTGQPPFKRAVLEAVAAVGYGEVRSYGEIAADVGQPLAARAVGTAIAGNPVFLRVPCHRIIRADGTLGEYGTRVWGRRGAQYKRALLQLEGVHL